MLLGIQNWSAYGALKIGKGGESCRKTHRPLLHHQYQRGYPRINPQKCHRTLPVPFLRGYLHLSHHRFQHGYLRLSHLQYHRVHPHPHPRQSQHGFLQDNHHQFRQIYRPINPRQYRPIYHRQCQVVFLAAFHRRRHRAILRAGLL